MKKLFRTLVGVKLTSALLPIPKQDNLLNLGQYGAKGQVFWGIKRFF
jgi:hypothetical protein